MIVLVPLENIDDNPFQERTAYSPDYIRELADSIRSLRDARPDTAGLIHVPVARPVDGEGHSLTGLKVDRCRFQLTVGHCRLRAFRRLAEEDHDAWWRMPLDVSDLDDKQMADIAWSENNSRRDLSPIERARALQKAIATFGYTQEALGERWHLSQGAVGNAVRLLSLPDWAVDAVHRGEMSERHGRALLMLLPLVPPWPPKSILRNVAGALRTADELETAVKAQIDDRTRELATAPWWASFEGWAPSAAGAEVRGSCEGCSCRVTVLRAQRCSDPRCHAAKVLAYKREITAPGRAKQLYQNQPAGWKRQLPASWGSCAAGCDRAARDLPGDWYSTGTQSVCPACWQAAGLPEPSSQPAETSTARTAAPTPYSPTPAPGPVTAARLQPTPITPQPQPAPPPAGTPAPRPAVPPPGKGMPDLRPVLRPAVLITVRILAGDDLPFRRVMLSIGEEGRAPSTMVAGSYAQLTNLFEEMTLAYFAPRPALSSEPGGEETLAEVDGQETDLKEEE